MSNTKFRFHLYQKCSMAPLFQVIIKLCAIISKYCPVHVDQTWFYEGVEDNESSLCGQSTSVIGLESNLILKTNKNSFLMHLSMCLIQLPIKFVHLFLSFYCLLKKLFPCLICKASYPLHVNGKSSLFLKNDWRTIKLSGSTLELWNLL